MSVVIISNMVNVRLNDDGMWQTDEENSSADEVELKLEHLGISRPWSTAVTDGWDPTLAGLGTGWSGVSMVLSRLKGLPFIGCRAFLSAYRQLSHPRSGVPVSGH